MKITNPDLHFFPQLYIGPNGVDLKSANPESEMTNPDLHICPHLSKTDP